MNATPELLPRILIPYDPSEALTISQASRLAARSTVTLRLWAGRHHLGRVVGGRWAVSKIALTMYLENDQKALLAYLLGDRESPMVLTYFERLGLTAKKV